jgi:peptidoglycan/LPS O-acetylase OafA/YrhL
MSTRPKRLDIQGIRAVAVLLVLLFHAEIPGFAGGYIGVDVFFVISGFLISSHLLESLRDRGTIGFGAFYARRARRLLPAAFTVIIATVVAAAVWVSPVQFPYVVNDALAAALYVPNMWFAYIETDYLAPKLPSLLLHYWSLGLEEQFYLVWPLLLWAVFRLRRRWLGAAIWMVTAASFAACLWLTATDLPKAFFWLPPRVWEFGLGALVAVAHLNRDRLLPPRLCAPAGWAGLAAIAVSGALFSVGTDFPGYAAALPVAGTAALITAGPGRGGPAALLSVRPLTWIGDISYSVYLVHWPALALPYAATAYTEPLPLWLRATIAALCLPAGWLLFTAVEQPGRHTRWLSTARPRRTIGLAVTGMAAVTVAVLATAAAYNPPVLDAGKSAPHTALTANPIGTTYVPSNLTPSLAHAHADRPAVYTNGCHRYTASQDPAGCRTGTDLAAPLVVLFGDSHAAQWYTALAVLADNGLIRLESHTKDGCPPASIEVRRYPQCDVWRDGVVDAITAAKPALVLLGSYGRYYTAAHRDATNAAWRDGLTRTIARFPPQTRVAIIADTPSAEVSRPICLGRFLDDAPRCAIPRRSAFDDDVRRAELDVVAAGHARYLDYTRYLCDATRCPAILLGDTLVYFDGNHITTAMSRALAGALAADIQTTLSG